VLRNLTNSPNLFGRRTFTSDPSGLSNISADTKDSSSCVVRNISWHGISNSTTVSRDNNTSDPANLSLSAEHNDMDVSNSNVMLESDSLRMDTCDSLKVVLPSHSLGLATSDSRMMPPPSSEPMSGRKRHIEQEQDSPFGSPSPSYLRLDVDSSERQVLTYNIFHTGMPLFLI